MKTLIHCPLLLLAVACTLLFSSCKKETFNEVDQSTFIPVLKRNSSLIFHYSSTASTHSGATGYNLFANYLNVYSHLDVLGTLTLGNIGGANNDTIYDAYRTMFSVVYPSKFHTNFDSTNVHTVINQHGDAPVVVNSAYTLSFTSSKITIKTTTKFFQPSSGEEYYLTPFLIVDSIVAAQAGHPDGAATHHRKSIVDVARIPGYPVRYMGYEVASGNINKGYQMNLTFEADRLASWTDTTQISVGLLLTKRTAAGKPIFVNANTNH